MSSEDLGKILSFWASISNLKNEVVYTSWSQKVFQDFLFKPQFIEYCYEPDTELSTVDILLFNSYKTT